MRYNFEWGAWFSDHSILGVTRTIARRDSLYVTSLSVSLRTHTWSTQKTTSRSECTLLFVSWMQTEDKVYCCVWEADWSNVMMQGILFSNWRGEAKISGLLDTRFYLMLAIDWELLYSLRTEIGSKCVNPRVGAAGKLNKKWKRSGKAIKLSIDSFNKMNRVRHDSQYMQHAHHNNSEHGHARISSSSNPNAVIHC